MLKWEFQNPSCLVKLRSHTALYHILSFNCLHLLISPMPVTNLDWSHNRQTIVIIKSKSCRLICPGVPCDFEAHGRYFCLEGPQSSSSSFLRQLFARNFHRSFPQRKAFRRRCSFRPKFNIKFCLKWETLWRYYFIVQSFEFAVLYLGP